MNHFEKINVLIDWQHGFRKLRSCESQLINTTNDILNSMVKQKSRCNRIRISKAFDKVHHKNLHLKLNHYGINSSLLNWIEDFLIGRTQ